MQASLVFAASHLLQGQFIGWLKDYFHYPRPPLALPPGTVHLLDSGNMHHSFPSGHTAFSALVAGSLWPVLNLYGRMLAVLYVAWAALSRVSLGVRFPTDVLAGIMTGIILAAALWPAARYLRRAVLPWRE